MKNTFTKNISNAPDTLKVFAYVSLWKGPFINGQSREYLVAKKPGNRGHFFYYIDNKTIESSNHVIEDSILNGVYEDVSKKYLTLEDSFEFYRTPDGVFGNNELYLVAKNKFTGKFYYYHHLESRWDSSSREVSHRQSILEGSWVQCDSFGNLTRIPKQVKSDSIKDEDIFLNSETGQVSVKIGPYRVKVGIVHVLEENVNGNLSQIELQLTNRKNQLDIVRKMVESVII